MKQGTSSVPGRLRLGLAALLAAAGLGAGWAGAPALAAGAGLQATEVEAFEGPTYTEAAPGFPRLLFVTEKSGVVRVLRDEAPTAQPFLDIEDLVSDSGEQGLLSIAFDPGYEQNRRFYLYFTNAAGDVEVDQFRRRRDSNVIARRSSRREVIVVPHPDQATNHNGGTAAFGPDGYLYLAPGDGGASSATAQDTGTLLGKLLRIDPRRDPERDRGYRIPPDNPFVGAPGRDAIFATGLRNPFRFSLDAGSDTIAVGDVGADAWEEVTLDQLGDVRGANFGWDVCEASACGGPAPANHLEPMHAYPHPLAGPVAITGGLIVRDPELPTLAGRYVFADFYAGDVQSFTPDLADNEAGGLASTGMTIPMPAAFTEGAAGQLYVTSLAGGIYRVEPAP